MTESQDTLQQQWLKKVMYLNPPWQLIPQVIQQIKLQKIHQTVLVTPFWPSQFWFPMILKMKHLDNPMIMKISKKFPLAAWRLSTKKMHQSGLMNEANLTYIASSTRKSTEKAYDNGVLNKVLK
jgi:hypothetical protein